MRNIRDFENPKFLSKINNSVRVVFNIWDLTNLFGTDLEIFHFNISFHDSDEELYSLQKTHRFKIKSRNYKNFITFGDFGIPFSLIHFINALRFV